MICLQLPINCDIPDWVNDERSFLPRDPSYRLYCNNDLLTERTWLWGNSSVIFEEIFLNLDQPARLQFRLEPVVLDPKHAHFYFGNLLGEYKIEIIKQEDLNLIAEIY